MSHAGTHVHDGYTLKTELGNSQQNFSQTYLARRGDREGE